MKIEPLSNPQIPIAAKIHKEALKGDFLPELGENFLKELYKSLLSQKNTYGFYASKNKEIAGFVIGTNDSSSLIKNALLVNPISMLTSLLISLIKNPSLIKNTLETLLYTQKDSGPKAELVIIAISKSFQNQGLGKKLISALESKFKQQNIKNYKLTVHAKKPAVKFYEHLKFKKIGKFNLYGKLWYIYEKKIK